MSTPIPAAKPLLLEALGIDFLTYVLGQDEEEVRRWIAGEIELGTLQAMQASRELWELMQRFPLDDDRLQRTFHISSLLGQYLPTTQRTIAGTVRGLAVGDDRPIATGDQIRDALGKIVADYYPIFLLPRPQGVPYGVAGPMVWGHPGATEFATAVKSDSDLMRLYPSSQGGQDAVGLVYKSTGSGGTVQLSMLLSSVLTEAWELVRVGRSSPPTPAEFLETALSQLDVVREAAAGRPAKTVVRVGLAGVLLPEGLELDLGWGKLRAASESDREVLPEDLKAELTSVDESGEIRISYGGNVVFESTADYKIEIVSEEAFRRGDRPDNFNEYLKLSHVLDTVRLALLLLDPDDPPLVYPAWQTIGDPLGPGRSVAFQNIREQFSLRPFLLTEEQAIDWSKKINIVREGHSSKIDVAVRRAVRAAAERNDPEDVLVDSVVAWENLVGSRQGEPTLRVSGALAWLLAPGVDRETRDEKRREIGKLYNLRSDVVHGNRPLKPEEQVTKPRAALRIALFALRALMIERPELLNECSSSDDRSARLLMGG